QFQGGRYDTNTLYVNFRNRDYSASLGRWLQVDPAGFGAGDTNLYRADGDGPVGHRDPSGLDWTDYWQPRAFFGSIWGDVYGGAKALVTGEAGEAIGQRAFDLSLRENGGRFTGSVSDWSRAGYHMVGQVAGTHSIAEGTVGTDMLSGQQLPRVERVTRTANGVGAAAGWAAG